MNDIKIIKIIISSSIADIERDILEVKAFFNTLNNTYIDRDIFFSVETAEPDSDESLLDGIGECELAFLIFYKKIGETLRHTFENAIEKYKDNEKPFIVPYFKFTDNAEDVSEDIKKFQDHLGNDLKHYYKSYSNIDTLKLYMIMQIKQMQIDSLPFEINGNMIKFAGKDFVPIDNIPAFANSKHLKELKEKLAEADNKFIKIKKEYFDDPENEELEEEYAGIISERKKLRKEIEEHENTLFENIKNIIKETTKGGLSQRQIKAYRLMEMGDYETALEILDHDAIMSDLKRSTSMADAFIENIQINANELAQRIAALKGTGITSDTSEKILEAYDELRGLIRKYGDLDKDPLYDYADFLYSQNDYEKAIEIAEEYLFYIKRSDSNTKLAKVYNLLGILYRKIQRYKDAEKIYLEALKILSDTNKISEPMAADVYANLGNVYRDTQRYKEAEEAHLEALEIRERSTEKDPDTFESVLAISYNNLGGLYFNIKKYKEAEEVYLEALAIRKRLAEKNPDIFEPYLAGSYNNLGVLYKDTQKYKQSEEAYLEALAIRKKLAEKNPDAFEPYLADSYNNLGVLYKDTQKYKQSEEAYLEALAIRKKLAEKNPDAFEPVLADSYNNLGILYSDTQRLQDAEETYLNALEIRKRLAQKNPDAFEPDLAWSYNNLGTLYHKIKKFKESEEAYLEALAIRKKLAEKNPDAFEPVLADSYNNLGILYSDTQRLQDAEETYLNALEIRKRLAQKNPDIFEPDLADTYNVLGIIYKDTQRLQEAEEAFLKAVEINKRSAEKNPYAFKPALANTYNDLGLLYMDAQRYNEAEEAFLNTMEIRKDLTAKDPGAFPSLAMIYCNLGFLYRKMQKTDKARDFFTAALEIFMRINKNGNFDKDIKNIKNYISLLQ